MEIVEKGVTLNEWFLATVHTCHRCKCRFKAGKKAKAGRDYALHEATYSRGSVSVKCPHCTGDLWLCAPTDPPTYVPVPYLPVPYPVWPNPWQPWRLNPIWSGVTVTSQTNGLQQQVLSAAAFPAAYTAGALTADANAVKALETRLSGDSVFEIVVS